MPGMFLPTLTIWELALCRRNLMPVMFSRNCEHTGEYPPAYAGSNAGHYGHVGDITIGQPVVFLCSFSFLVGALCNLLWLF